MNKNVLNRSGFCITASYGQVSIRIEISLTWLLTAASIAFRLCNLFTQLPH